MSDVPSNRVRPIVRLLAGLVGVAFALAGLAGIALLAFSIWSGVRTGHFSGKSLLIGVVVPLGAYSVGSICLVTAWTGENPQWDDDEPSAPAAPAV
jgi:nitrogen fixation-related uncharacterized protein